MSSREPLWFCHECNAEMRPLMVPHPVCASCRSDFVEKMDNLNDDPREFTHGEGDYDGEDFPPGVGTFLFDVQQLFDRAMGQGLASPRAAARSGNPRNLFSQSRSGGFGPRPTTDRSDRPPTMSEYLGGTNRATTGSITGPLMAQYLMALLAQRSGDEFSGRLGFGDPAMTGRLGDYVFNQEALDEIITQLMNESNAHRPVPASEDVVSSLPREILAVTSPLLEKDCAVCKEQFKLETEDPAEQIIVTLPCTHPFHEPCILPWLKSSGTCPVCRYALVAQPNHSPDPASGSNLHRYRPANPSNQNGFSRQQHDSPGIWQSFFGLGRSRPSTHIRSNSDPTTRPRNSRDNHLPGGWEDDLD